MTTPSAIQRSKNTSRSLQNPMPEITIIEADLQNPKHQEAVIECIIAFAQETPNYPYAISELPERLIDGLQRHPMTLILLAYRGEQAVGIAVCYQGFSTFAARPLLNLHDLWVHPDVRRQGIGSRLLERFEAAARTRGCAVLTLEVLQDNPARCLYERFGFNADPHDDQETTFFWKKKL